MAKYTLLVIDDDNNRSDAYKKIFTRQSILNLEFVNNKYEMNKIEKNNYDGYIVDIVLDGWEVDLVDVLNDIGDKGPVFLISQKWISYPDVVLNKLNKSISQQIQQYFIWDDNYNEGHIDENSVETMRYNVVRSLDKYHDKAEYNPATDETINILHISDTQFGDSEVDPKSMLLDVNVGNFFRKENKQIHFLVVSGDVAFTGKPSEYRAAVNWFENLIQEVWPQTFEKMRERIIIVPGNHDVNLRLCLADKFNIEPTEDGKYKNQTIKSKDITYEHQYAGLSPFREFCYKLTKDIRYIESSNLFWVNRQFDHFGLRFFLLNSVSSMGLENTKKYYLDNDGISTIRNDLKNIMDSENYFNIAVSHNGFEIPGIPEAEPIKNWESNLTALFETYKMDLFLHGHGHAWSVTEHQKGEYIFNMVVAMAPTSHLSQKRIPKDEQRGFNLIELSRKEGKVDNIAGTFYPLITGKVDALRKKSRNWDKHDY